MKAKKVIFDEKDFEEASKGYPEVIVEVNASPYEKAIMKELKKKTWITPTDITKKIWISRKKYRIKSHKIGKTGNFEK